VRDADPARVDGIELFTSLSPEELRDLEKRCSWRRYERNELILDRDSDSRDVYFVVDGKVQVANYSFSGREIALATIPSGGYFGELSAIDHLPRSATVTAGEKCLLAALSPTVFSELLEDHPGIALQVLQRLAKIIRVCDERIMDLSTLGAVQRVYVELLRLASPDAAVSSLWSIYPMPTQADVAGRASTTRETVARVLGHLSNGGLIQRKGKTLYINDRDRLAELSERLKRDDAEAVSR